MVPMERLETCVALIHASIRLTVRPYMKTGLGKDGFGFASTCCLPDACLPITELFFKDSLRFLFCSVPEV